MKNSRQAAFEILLKILKNSAYSNLELDSALKSSDFERRDKAFVSAVVYGVLERKLTLDYNIEKYLTQKLKKLKPEVYVILLMGAYQILFMEKVPASAAVNESVKLTKKNGCAFASGLCNAVLRKIDKAGLILPNKDDFQRYLSIKYSFPVWLVKLWSDSYGEENAEKIMSCADLRPPLTVRVNTLKTSSKELSDMLAEQGVSVDTSELCADALILGTGGSVEELSGFSDGLFHVQDIASQLCVRALGIGAGETVIDVCAAPGGKSFTAAQLMENSGKLISCDLHSHRVKLIEQGAERLGITCIKAVASDASEFNLELPLADRVLCDVPCSGLGIVRRKPEIRYKEKESIDNLPDLQYRILDNAARYVKKGGRLLYSTCALNPAENGSVGKKFLKNHSEFKSVSLPFDLPHGIEEGNFLTLMPHLHGCDGFFIALFERID